MTHLAELVFCCSLKFLFLKFLKFFSEVSLFETFCASTHFSLNDTAFEILRSACRIKKSPAQWRDFLKDCRRYFSTNLAMAGFSIYLHFESIDLNPRVGKLAVDFLVSVGFITGMWFAFILLILCLSQVGVSVELFGNKFVWRSTGFAIICCH